MTQRNDAKQLTILRLWDYLGADYSVFPNWPPDLFAMCAAVLKKSGAYTTIVNPFNEDATSEGIPHDQDEHAKHLVEIGNRWREALDTYGAGQMPADWTVGSISLEDLKKPWTTVKAGIDLEVFKVADDADIATSLLDLLAISDEACKGLGLPVRAASKYNLFREEAEEVLFPKQFGSTLCKAISPSTARVLPKMHTAQCGLTVRSFSHHLAYCESDEVRPSWISVPGSRGNAREISRMNILIAPWPQKIFPSQITQVKESPQIHLYDSFEFDIRSTNGKIAEQCLGLANEAEKAVGEIDAVVFPELAMTTRDYRLVRSALLSKGILTIAGIGSKSRCANYLAVDVPISRHHAVHFRQRKHHRWKLDETQIHQYHLGSRLRPEKSYWEHIDVQDRQLNFIVLRPWLVATALICEDLARHDPVGELIKGVGPNLVLALLMDGPQITQRWPARYAAGLADDPGSSVLSITSLGMAELSRPKGNDGKSSRVIALWKDAFSGSPTQMDMPRDSDGVVITLTMTPGTEKTADYRTDGGLASYPSLAGFHFVKLPPEGHAPHLSEPPKSPIWVSPSEAGFLSRLAQSDSLQCDFMPAGLDEIHGSAFKIGREMWCQKTNGNKPKGTSEWPNRDTWASEEEEDTARQIINWHKTNQSPWS